MASAAKSAIQVYGMDKALDTFTKIKEGFGRNSKWIVGVGVEYGAYVEFGTSTTRAYPYLMPAVRHVMRSEFDSIESAAMSKSNPIEYLIEELARRIEREAKKRASGRPGPNVITGDLRASIEAAPAGAGS